MTEKAQQIIIKSVMTAIYARVADFGSGFDDQYFESKTARLSGSMDDLGYFDLSLQAKARRMLKEVGVE